MFNGNVSSNDIITAAPCEANLATNIFAFTIDMRSLHCNCGGAFYNKVRFPKNALFSYSISMSKITANLRAFRKI